MKFPIKTLMVVTIIFITMKVSANHHESVMWEYSKNFFIGASAEVLFDERVVVLMPDFAEDSMQVPLMVDASQVNESIEKIIAWADYNPIQHIFTFYPQENLSPKLSLPFKVQQSTPVRAAVLTRSGKWLVGSSFVNAAGGGCTLPSESRQTDDWQTALGRISAGRFSSANDQILERMKFKVMHPMDTGLVANIPSFYIESVELRASNNQRKGLLELSPAVAENPVFTFDTLIEQDDWHLWIRDNDGNEFKRSF